MKKTSLIATLAVLCCITLSSYASADGVLAGEYGYGNFDRIIQIATSDIFAAPGVVLDKAATEFTAGNTAGLGSTYNEAVFDTWAVTYSSATEVSMSGDPLNTLAWNYNFNTTYASTAFSFDFQAFNGDQLVDRATVSYNGRGLNDLANYTFTPYNPTTVPEPATAIMLLFGIAATGVAGYRRKTLRK